MKLIFNTTKKKTKQKKGQNQKQKTKNKKQKKKHKCLFSAKYVARQANHTTTLRLFRMKNVPRAMVPLHRRLELDQRRESAETSVDRRESTKDLVLRVAETAKRQRKRAPASQKPRAMKQNSFQNDL